MRNERKTAIVGIAVLLTAVVGLSLLGALAKRQTESGAYDLPLTPAPLAEDAMQGISSEDWTVDESFSSNLPLVILDTGDERPPISMEQEKDGTFRPIPGVEPYRSGTLRVIDTGDVNTLHDKASYVSDVRLKRRGNSSMLYEKAQYLVKLVTESGQDNELDLMGMGAESEWVLNGSMADKSMMRNYLSYRMASAFMPYTPDSRYCEVLYYENGQYHYEGVYLLIESIKQGPERVDISEAKSSDQFPSYIVRRDRAAEDEIILDTWATAGPSKEARLGLIYPTQKNATPEAIEYVTEDLSRIEKVLYSDDPEVFATYSRYIDVDSFVDYFLFNEFFGSYDAGKNSTYMYKELGGKLHMGPVWDLDGALDNYVAEPLEWEVTAFQTQPWFDRLSMDDNFLDKLERRYAELRRGPLSDKALYETVDGIAAYLGPAVEREWTRWGHIYTTFNRYSMQSDGGLVRNTSEFRQEVYRIKTSISRHAEAIGPYLDVLEKSAEMNTDASLYTPLALLLAILVFAVPAYYASRK